MPKDGIHPPRYTVAIRISTSTILKEGMLEILPTQAHSGYLYRFMGKYIELQAALVLSGN